MSIETVVGDLERPRNEILASAASRLLLARDRIRHTAASEWLLPPSEAIKRIAGADIVVYGDYHALPAIQAGILSLLTELAKRDPAWRQGVGVFLECLSTGWDLNHASVGMTIARANEAIDDIYRNWPWPAVGYRDLIRSCVGSDFRLVGLRDSLIADRVVATNPYQLIASIDESSWAISFLDLNRRSIDAVTRALASDSIKKAIVVVGNFHAALIHGGFTSSNRSLRGTRECAVFPFVPELEAEILKGDICDRFSYAVELWPGAFRLPMADWGQLSSQLRNLEPIPKPPLVSK